VLDFIRGRVVSRDTEAVVLEAGGLGFRLLIPGFVEGSEGFPIGREVLLYVDLTANLDRPGQAFTIVGFREPLQRDFFEVFKSVGGIGPRGAVRALASTMESIAQAIEEGDVRMLKTLPGVGPGKAKKIIAELRGRMTPFCRRLPRSAAGMETQAGPPEPGAPGGGRFLYDVQTALETLGYQPAEIREHIRHVTATYPDVQTVEHFLQKVFEQG
jgi:holliday junction DNA helicase RuvA